MTLTTFRITFVRLVGVVLSQVSALAKSVGDGQEGIAGRIRFLEVPTDDNPDAALANWQTRWWMALVGAFSRRQGSVDMAEAYKQVVTDLRHNGWSPGPEYDGENRLHPCAVPWERLDDAEKLVIHMAQASVRACGILLHGEERQAANAFQIVERAPTTIEGGVNPDARDNAIVDQGGSATGKVAPTALGEKRAQLQRLEADREQINIQLGTSLSPPERERAQAALNEVAGRITRTVEEIKELEKQPVAEQHRTEPVIDNPVTDKTDPATLARAGGPEGEEAEKAQKVAKLLVEQEELTELIGSDDASPEDVESFKARVDEIETELAELGYKQPNPEPEPAAAEGCSAQAGGSETTS